MTVAPMRSWGSRLAITVLALLPLQMLAQEASTKSEEGANAPDALSASDVNGSSFRLIRDVEARRYHHVSGVGLAVAVVDSGVNSEHPVFTKSDVVLPGIDFTGSEPGNLTDDERGSGSHRAGVIAAQGGTAIPEGVAPGAKIVPVKIIDNSGGVPIERIVTALRWIADPATRASYRDEHKVTISAVCLALGSAENLRDPDKADAKWQPLRAEIKKLRDLHIAVCAPAGNNFCDRNYEEGMIFPAICPETISVGAVYDANVEPKTGSVLMEFNDAKVFGTRRDQITAFSQRLSSQLAIRGSGTDIFAPGASIVSVGTRRMEKPQIQSGTSISASIVTGAVVLLQERCRNLTKHIGKPDPDWLPDLNLIKRSLREGAVQIEDTPNETLDTVGHTGHKYRRLDVMGSIRVLNDIYQGDVTRIRQLVLKNAKSKPNYNPDEPIEFSLEEKIGVLGKEFGITR